MIKHIVLFKLTDNLTKEEKFRITNEMKTIFLPLKDKINRIISYEIGINFNAKDFASDFAIYSEFENVEDLNYYSNHPEHVKAVNKNKKFNKTKTVIDYEI